MLRLHAGLLTAGCGEGDENHLIGYIVPTATTRMYVSQLLGVYTALYVESGSRWDELGVGKKVVRQKSNDDVLILHTRLGCLSASADLVH